MFTFFYNFDMVNQKIIEYNSQNSDTCIVELCSPLLSFINYDFCEYDLLRHKILQFIQDYELKFDEMDSDEILLEIKKTFPDFRFVGIDTGEVWWIAELSNYLVYKKTPFRPFFLICDPCKDAIQNEGNYDYLYWQSEILDKVKKIFDIDYSDFIDDFSPICRLNYFYDELFAFKEIAIVHPSNFECFTDGYEFFAIPFHAFDENPAQAKLSDDEYAKKKTQRQEFIKEHLYVINGYGFHSLAEAFNCEILKMAQIGITLKCCENCGKYFRFNPNQPAKYCPNKLSGMNMTCQQIGAQKKYNSNLSPIQKAYTNALKNRNKWYPSKKSGLRTPEQTREYENWKKRTSKIRDTFQKKYNNAHTDMQREKILEEFKRNINE